jgi:hypothetical protein
MEVYIGKKDKLKTRLLISPVPGKIASERIRKAEQGGKRSDDYTISKEYRIKAHYNLYITNVSYYCFETNIEILIFRDLNNFNYLIRIICNAICFQ